MKLTESGELQSLLHDKVREPPVGDVCQGSLVACHLGSAEREQGVWLQGLQSKVNLTKLLARYPCPSFPSMGFQMI